MVWFEEIREQDPLKQGLKPAYKTELVQLENSWARSTKTRIETLQIQDAAISIYSSAFYRILLEIYWILSEDKYLLTGTGEY